MVKFQIEFYIMWKIEARLEHVHLGHLVLPSDSSSRTLLLSFETRCQLSGLGQSTTYFSQTSSSVQEKYFLLLLLLTRSLSTTSSPTFVVVLKLDESYSIICLIFLLKKGNNFRPLPFRLLSPQASRFVRARFVFFFFFAFVTQRATSSSIIPSKDSSHQNSMSICPSSLPTPSFPLPHRVSSTRESTSSPCIADPSLTIITDHG